MSQRATRLFEEARVQIGELRALLSTAQEPVLRAVCPGREKLGDGTVAAVALHTADTYRRIADFVHGRADHAHAGKRLHDHSGVAQHIDTTALIQRLTDGRRAIGALANLTDEQLDAIPPAGQARFCDGTRTLEQVLASMLKHQRHQIDALKAAIT